MRVSLCPLQSRSFHGKSFVEDNLHGDVCGLRERVALPHEIHSRSHATIHRNENKGAIEISRRAGTMARRLRRGRATRDFCRAGKWIRTVAFLRVERAYFKFHDFRKEACALGDKETGKTKT